MMGRKYQVLKAEKGSGAVRFYPQCVVESRTYTSGGGSSLSRSTHYFYLGKPELRWEPKGKDSFIRLEEANRCIEKYLFDVRMNTNKHTEVIPYEIPESEKEE